MCRISTYAHETTPTPQAPIKFGCHRGLPAAVLWNVAARSEPAWRGLLKHVCRDMHTAIAKIEREEGTRSVILMKVAGLSSRVRLDRDSATQSLLTMAFSSRMYV